MHEEYSVSEQSLLHNFSTKQHAHKYSNGANFPSSLHCKPNTTAWTSCHTTRLMNYARYQPRAHVNMLTIMYGSWPTNSWHHFGPIKTLLYMYGRLTSVNVYPMKSLYIMTSLVCTYLSLSLRINTGFQSNLLLVFRCQPRSPLHRP